MKDDVSTKSRDIGCLNIMVVEFISTVQSCQLWVLMFNVTFNNLTVISLQLILFVEETGVHGETHRPDANHWQTLSHNVGSSTPRHDRSPNSNFIGDKYCCIGSWNPAKIRSQPRCCEFWWDMITCVDHLHHIRGLFGAYNWMIWHFRCASGTKPTSIMLDL
jgi:hypothetical protein